jgi:hypothetical protein
VLDLAMIQSGHRRVDKLVPRNSWRAAFPVPTLPDFVTGRRKRDVIIAKRAQQRYYRGKDINSREDQP